jgi:hypothetical protein
MNDRKNKIGIIIITAILFVFFITGCSKENSDWETAKKANSEGAYQGFVAKYPNGTHIGEANNAVEKLKYKKGALPIFIVILLILGGYRYYIHNMFQSGKVGVLLSGGIVFEPSESGFSRSALCFRPLRTPHFYESGIEVDFFAPDLNLPSDLAMRDLIESGAAKQVKSNGDSMKMYRVSVPKKLVGQWR